jgi:hypothetical protein
MRDSGYSTNLRCRIVVLGTPTCCRKFRWFAQHDTIDYFICRVGNYVVPGGFVDYHWSVHVCWIARLLPSTSRPNSRLLQISDSAKTCIGICPREYTLTISGSSSLSCSRISGSVPPMDVTGPTYGVAAFQHGKSSSSSEHSLSVFGAAYSSSSVCYPRNIPGCYLSLLSAWEHPDGVKCYGVRQ